MNHSRKRNAIRPLQLTGIYLNFARALAKPNDWPARSFAAMRYLKNDQLDSIRPEWPGNPFSGGQFRYVEQPPFQPTWRKLLRWMLSPNPQKREKQEEHWRPQLYRGPMEHDSQENFIAWLGHASFLIQIDGFRLLTDPVFFDLPFLKRYVPTPWPADQIRDIDYVLLSHDHRDHCDQESIQALLRNNRPRKILTALRMSELIAPWMGDSKTIIEEAAWYQRYATPEGLEVIFLPARHWGRRGLMDFNRRLWGSFIIRTPETTIYFGADSGYGPHFRDIGRRFPDIDLAIIGIGAYKPTYMMEEIHTSPCEAMRAFLDLGARRLLPMHYGTFDLSNEPLGEPYWRIRELFDEQEMPEALVLPSVGQPVGLGVTVSS